MAHVAELTFNPFQENTYIVYDDTKECVIFDPGCSTPAEKEQLKTFIASAQLKPVRLINTHCHIDHILGNKFVADTYNLDLEIHEGELVVLQNGPMVAQMYGIPYAEHSPMPSKYIKAGDVIEFGETQLKALFTPGHSPASLSFHCAEHEFVIAGDVLFHGSIGRTDLPGGDFNTLITSIKNKLLVLDDATRIYAGHGPSTTIGFERANNPFLQ